MTEQRTTPLVWFLLGAVFGAAMALLFSPVPGAELRARIAERAEWNRALEEMRKVREALEKARKGLEEAREEREEPMEQEQTEEETA
jgi:gas vesicle protein